MSEPFIGEIKMVGFNFPPRGWANCNGQLLQISQNTALFSLLGTYYGGDGRTTFGLPDLRGRVPVHTGTGPGLSPYNLASRGGSERVTLSTAQMPSHSHSVDVTVTPRGTSSGGDSTDPTGRVWAAGRRETVYADSDNVDMAAISGSGTAADQGGSQNHENRPPYLTIRFVIALVGIFPSRN